MWNIPRKEDFFFAPWPQDSDQFEWHPTSGSRAEIIWELPYMGEKATATHSSTLAWRIPWMQEPGGLQSVGLLRVGHDWATSLSLFTFMHWRRKWQPTPVLLPGESQGWRSLVGCSPWSCSGLDMTERLNFHFSLSCIGEGNGNPLQCSCLENPREGGARWVAICEVTQSRTRLKWLSSSSSSRMNRLPLDLEPHYAFTVVYQHAKWHSCYDHSEANWKRSKSRQWSSSWNS